MFQQVAITDDRVTAVIPTADFAPFFNLAVANTETGLTALAAPDCQLDVLRGGSDGLRSHARTTATGTVLVGLPPERRTVGSSGRAPYTCPRQGRLTAEERAAIRRADGQSLRSLAAEFGVSHETIRAVLTSATTATVD